MLRSQFLIFIAIAAQGAIWPPGIQEFARQGDPKPVELSDAVLKEYGVVAAETGDYKAGARTFTATAWRFKDATGAVAASQMLSPATAKGNYVIQVSNGRLSRSEIDGVFRDLAEFREPPPPTLPTYVPKGVEDIHYILGPESLKQFMPGINPDLAGVNVSVEAETGQTKIGGRPARFALFRYPTPQLARMKETELGQAVPSSTVKRSGPLVAVVWPSEGPALDAKAAETFLRPVEFRAVLIENAPNPERPIKDAAKMLLSIFTLTGGLLVACLVGGAVIGGIRIFNRRGEDAGGALQTLHLQD